MNREQKKKKVIIQKNRYSFIIRTEEFLDSSGPKGAHFFFKYIIAIIIFVVGTLVKLNRTGGEKKPPEWQRVRAENKLRLT